MFLSFYFAQSTMHNALLLAFLIFFMWYCFLVVFKDLVFNYAHCVGVISLLQTNFVMVVLHLERISYVLLTGPLEILTLGRMF